jgi:hypothetical protein
MSPPRKRSPRSLILDGLQGLGVTDVLERLGMTGPSWGAWQTIAKVRDGQPLDETERAVFRQITGRDTVPEHLVELWAIAGRRSGKSRYGSAEAVHAATRRYRLARGERARVLVLSVDREQAGVIYDYILSAFLDDAELKPLIKGEPRKSSFDLVHGVTAQVHTSSYRRVRGYTCCAVICDEIAQWWDETTANPDVEILRALRPGLATVPGSRLICVTTPFARRGAAWEAFEKHHANDQSDVLVVHAPTVTLNPTIPQRVLDAAARDDVVAHATECVRYVAFVDMSGGRVDSAALAVAHVENGIAVLDLTRERKAPFNPQAVVGEFAETVARYGVGEVTGDNYGAEITAEMFREHGLKYTVSRRDKSALYGELLPALNSGRAELLDLGELRRQLTALERRTSRGGRETIDHRPGANDDVANACAGALVHALGIGVPKKRPVIFSFGPPYDGPRTASTSRLPAYSARRGLTLGRVLGARQRTATVSTPRRIR